MAGKVKLSRKGMAQLLKSTGVQADLERRARKIAERAGEGHEASSRIGKTRARASVITTSFDAMRREATDRNLTRSFDAGRG